MGAGKGGGGGGSEAAAAVPEAAQPVVLKMDLHCAGCAHKVKKAIKRVPGTCSRRGNLRFTRGSIILFVLGLIHQFLSLTTCSGTCKLGGLVTGSLTIFWIYLSDGTFQEFMIFAIPNCSNPFYDLVISNCNLTRWIRTPTV